MRVLVIEDSEIMRELIRGMLETGGHQVVDAGNGRDGLELFRQEAFDAVVTDIVMPDVEGIETIMGLRQHNPKIRIVAISAGASGGASDYDYLRVAKTLGADATLTKPFDSDALLAAVQAK